MKAKDATPSAQDDEQREKDVADGLNEYPISNKEYPIFKKEKEKKENLAIETLLPIFKPS